MPKKPLNLLKAILAAVKSNKIKKGATSDFMEIERHVFRFFNLILSSSILGGLMKTRCQKCFFVEKHC